MRASLMMLAVASLVVAIPLEIKRTEIVQDNNVTTNNVLTTAIHRCFVGPAYGTPRTEELKINPETGRPQWPDDIYDPIKAGNYTACLAEGREAIRYCKYYGEGAHTSCRRIVHHYKKMTKTLVDYDANLAAIRRWRRHIWLTASGETPNEGYPEWCADGKWPDGYWSDWYDDEPIIPAERDEVRPWDRPGNPRPRKKKKDNERRDAVDEFLDLSAYGRLRDCRDEPKYDEKNPDPALQAYDPVKVTPVDIAGCLLEAEEVIAYLDYTGPTGFSIKDPKRDHLKKAERLYADLKAGRGEPTEIMAEIRRLRMSNWLGHGSESGKGYPDVDYQGFWPDGWWDEETRPIDPPKKGDVRPWLEDLESRLGDGEDDD